MWWYRQNVYIELGDYQTLLRPIRQADESADTADDDVHTVAAENMDSSRPPSPTLYGDDTLRAVAVITQKYDSFRRRQMRVRSFLAARISRSTSRDSTSACDDVLADSFRRETSVVTIWKFWAYLTSSPDVVLFSGLRWPLEVTRGHHRSPTPLVMLF